MGAVSLLEGTSLTAAEWRTRLRISQEEFHDLVEAGVLRPERSATYRLSFVGMVVFTNSLLIAQPKFGDASPLTLTSILRVLRTYFGRSPLRTPSVDATRDPEFGNSDILREFDALQGLQEWFFNHGVYRRDQALAGAVGRPHWVKTIATRSPLIAQGSAVYPTVVAERRVGTFNDVSALQIGVLQKLLKRYGFEVPPSVASAEQATGAISPGWPLSDDQRNFYLRRLGLEQRGAFRTDTLRLLKLLKEALDSRSAAATRRPQIYGTTAFYAVWEDMCRAALADGSATDPASMIGQPAWWSHRSTGLGEKYCATQIPDIVVVRSPWQLVIDAKYYYRFPESRPGAPDIVKQLYYAEALREESGHVLSVFLLPMPGAVEPALIGHATIEGARRPFGTIEAWGVDPASIVSRYLSASTHRNTDLIEPILAKRQRMAELLG